MENKFEMKEKKISYSLDLLRDMMSNDEEEVDKMIRIFLDTAPEILSKLNEGLANNDMQQVYLYSHKLKSSIDIFHITELTDLIRELEKNSKDKINIENIPTQIEKVNEIINDVLKGISKEIS